MKSIFIFRRDLRLVDNTALINALEESDTVACCFVMDPRQLKSPYRSDGAVQFMVDSLKEVDDELRKKNSKLHLFYGKSEEEIEKLIKKEKIGAVYINKDYTPFSKKRDKKIESVCKKNSIKFFSYDDCLLTTPGAVLTGQGKPYSIYTPFSNKAIKQKIPNPKKNSKKNYYSKKIPGSKDIKFLETLVEKRNPDLLEKGGRSNALKILRGLGKFKKYKQERDIPSIHGTTRLSAHNKFGTISVREFYYGIVDKLGPTHILVKQLLWRDFFTHIIHHYPHVLGHSFHPKYDKLKWSNDKKRFKKWCQGKTGFPIVDAGMRELNKTGWMHNRVRLITASFLVKDLHIDWRWGEKYFAQKLVDYDPAVNNGNWQWAASTGCDAQPYFRIFNPWRQQERFDPDCEYIKKWVPELKKYSAKELHKWKGDKKYPAPMIDHSTESSKTKAAYSSLR
jgi:deoxyribodipyrimidine photo-lyase